MPVNTIEIAGNTHARDARVAERVRGRLREQRTPALNLISSAGSGKTLLLERTLQALNEELSLAVVTGDSAAQADAERLSRHTGRLVQAVLTSGSSHLDARQIDRALRLIDLQYTDLVLIENVGNLVHPATWDIGETAKVVLYSVTEGEDKPLKYPAAFRNATCVVFTKVDLLPHLTFDMDLAVANARAVNQEMRLFFTSALNGAGLDGWFDFLRAAVREARASS